MQTEKFCLMRKCVRQKPRAINALWPQRGETHARDKMRLLLLDEGNPEERKRTNKYLITDNTKNRYAKKQTKLVTSSRTSLGVTQSGHHMRSAGARGPALEGQICRKKGLLVLPLLLRPPVRGPVWRPPPSCEGREKGLAADAGALRVLQLKWQ